MISDYNLKKLKALPKEQIDKINEFVEENMYYYDITCHKIFIDDDWYFEYKSVSTTDAHRPYECTVCKKRFSNDPRMHVLVYHKELF